MWALLPSREGDPFKGDSSSNPEPCNELLPLTKGSNRQIAQDNERLQVGKHEGEKENTLG